MILTCAAEIQLYSEQVAVLLKNIKGHPNARSNAHLLTSAMARKSRGRGGGGRGRGRRTTDPLFKAVVGPRNMSTIAK